MKIGPMSLHRGRADVHRMIELARNFFDEMEADSRRFLETPPVFAGVIRVKHPLDILRGNADTVIFDFKHRPVFIAEDIQLQSVTLAR